MPRYDLRRWRDERDWKENKARHRKDLGGGEYLLKMPFVLWQRARKYFRCFRIFKRVQKRFLLLISDFALFCSRRSTTKTTTTPSDRCGAVCKFTVLLFYDERNNLLWKMIIREKYVQYLNNLMKIRPRERKRKRHDEAGEWSSSSTFL